MANVDTYTGKDTGSKGIKSSVGKIMGNENLHEGKTTSVVENQTGKLPSMTWLGLAVGSMAASAAVLASSERKEYANFVGLWAPCFLLIGIYNKLVKLEGNDRFSKGAY